MRGVKFKRFGTHYSPRTAYHYEALDALDDVKAWLGIRTREEYNILSNEQRRRRIRAKWEEENR